MADALFAHYQARGIANRSALAFTKEYRDTHPVTDWEQVHPEDWVTLSEASFFHVFLSQYPVSSLSRIVSPRAYRADQRLYPAAGLSSANGVFQKDAARRGGNW
jgi:hypothetical protein